MPGVPGRPEKTYLKTQEIWVGPRQPPFPPDRNSMSEYLIYIYIRSIIVEHSQNLYGTDQSWLLDKEHPERGTAAVLKMPHRENRIAPTPYEMEGPLLLKPR